jgi:hypothetical protein
LNVATPLEFVVAVPSTVLVVASVNVTVMPEALTFVVAVTGAVVTPVVVVPGPVEDNASVVVACVIV